MIPTVEHPQRARVGAHELAFGVHGDAGADDGGAARPVVLIMGYTMPGRAWRFQVGPLAAERRVLTYDHAGVGESGPLERRFPRMEEMAQEVVELMNHVGWADAHIVGISMGGMVAQHVALNRPERVASLSLIATHAGGVGVVPPARGLRLFVRANRKKGAQRLDAVASLLFSRTWLERNGELAQTVLADDFARPPERRVRLGQLHAVLRHDTRARLPRLGRHRTLVVQPTHDVLIRPRASAFIARRVPGAELVSLPAGHGITRERPDELNAALQRHFAVAEAERQGEPAPASLH